MCSQSHRSGFCHFCFGLSSRDTGFPLPPGRKTQRKSTTTPTALQRSTKGKRTPIQIHPEEGTTIPSAVFATMPITIPQFLLPRGAPSTRTLHTLTRQRTIPTHRRTFTTSLPGLSQNQNDSKNTLAQPDKFRPPSHPARRVVQTRNGKASSGPVNYPGPRLSEKEQAEKKTRQYPKMFPPEGTVMFKFLTSRWIHVWIAMVPPPPPPPCFCSRSCF